MAPCPGCLPHSAISNGLGVRSPPGILCRYRCMPSCVCCTEMCAALALVRLCVLYRGWCMPGRVCVCVCVCAVHGYAALRLVCPIPVFYDENATEINIYASCTKTDAC
eukprot:1137343-Pelagomonas_calceolata.AAC.8